MRFLDNLRFDTDTYILGSDLAGSSGAYTAEPPLDSVRLGLAVFQQGMMGASIRDIQRMLNCDDGSTKFGPKTRAAVMDFQKRAKLPQTGIVDRATLLSIEQAMKLYGTAAATKPANTPTPTPTTPGSAADAVLNELGVPDYSAQTGAPVPPPPKPASESSTVRSLVELLTARSQVPVAPVPGATAAPTVPVATEPKFAPWQIALAAGGGVVVLAGLYVLLRKAGGSQRADDLRSYERLIPLD